MDPRLHIALIYWLIVRQVLRLLIALRTNPIRIAAILWLLVNGGQTRP